MSDGCQRTLFEHALQNIGKQVCVQFAFKAATASSDQMSRGRVSETFGVSYLQEQSPGGTCVSCF